MGRASKSRTTVSRRITFFLKYQHLSVSQRREHTAVSYLKRKRGGLGDCFVPLSLWYYCERAGVRDAVSVECSGSGVQCCSEGDIIVVEVDEEMLEEQGA